MAIYHHSTKIIARSAGKSAVAAAAYRSGTKLYDDRTGITHDYTRKTGVDHSVILAPKNADWICDRQKLWDEVERSEHRINSQVSREVEIAIPIELDRESKIKLITEYIQQNYVDLGMIADANFHHLDSRNPHAHVMLTMRDLVTDADGNVQFSAKKNRDWNSTDLLIKNRENWAKIANQYLVDAGHLDVKIDHRSNADRGIETIPQIHLGAAVIAMQKKGIAAERGDEYDRIEIVNHNIRDKLEEIFASESATRDLEHQLAEFDRRVSDQKDREFALLARKNPVLKQTQEEKEKYLRAKAKEQEAEKAPRIKKWNLSMKKNIDPQLVSSIIATADRLGKTDYQAGNYQVQILPDDEIKVSYQNNSVMIIYVGTCNALPLDRAYTVDQYGLGLQRSIDLLLIEIDQPPQTKPEQTKPEQAEPDIIEDSEIIIEDSEIEIKTLCAKRRRQNDRGGIGN